MQAAGLSTPSPASLDRVDVCSRSHLPHCPSPHLSFRMSRLVHARRSIASSSFQLPEPDSASTRIDYSPLPTPPKPPHQTTHHHRPPRQYCPHQPSIHQCLLPPHHSSTTSLSMQHRPHHPRVPHHPPQHRVCSLSCHRRSFRTSNSLVSTSLSAPTSSSSRASGHSHSPPCPPTSPPHT